MSGHGHVVPNADGSVARCGGPAICPACALEAARVERTSDGDVITPPEQPTVCPRCRGPVDALGVCRRRCDLDGGVTRKDVDPEHPTGGGAE